MLTRLFVLSLLLCAALVPSGCSEMDQSADDQMNAYHSTPAPQSNGDDHGWGTGLSVGGH